MIEFKLQDGHKVQIERDAIEERILTAILEKVDQGRTHEPGLYTMMKQSINMFLTMGKIDLKIPKGVNALEFLIAHYVTVGMDLLEKEALEVDGTVIKEFTGEEGKECTPVFLSEIKKNDSNG